MDNFTLLLAVPLLPLGAWVIQVLVGQRLPRGGDWLPTGAMLAAAAAAVSLYLRAKGLDEIQAAEFVRSSTLLGESFQLKWLVSQESMQTGLASFQAGLWYDAMTAPLLAMVSVVSLLVHVFSIGYMKGDARYPAYFAGLALFSFAMLAMLISDNLLFLFGFWELMGLCSYLLISHYALDPAKPRTQAARASLKAFMTTRIGDVALLIGLAILWNGLGTLQFHEMYTRVAELREQLQGWPAWLEVGGVLILLGAVGKSAQFPLHVWLPDAMEGPTPVSAMIHAATMVAAGVYLLARAFPLFPPSVLALIAVLGSFTAIFAATLALTAFDLKKVLAYSTISQLGFMTAAVGLGSPEAALFHVFTHGLFKAGLFLGAGAIIHACHHQQDLRLLGGLRKRMPITALSMLLFTAAISGVPWMSGYFSKDAILAFALERSAAGAGTAAWLPAIFLIAAAVLTVLYMFRMYFLVFAGPARSDPAAKASEVPAVMSGPLVLLALGAIFGGMLWLAVPQVEQHAHALATAFAVGALALGLILAILYYGLRLLRPERVSRACGPLYQAAILRFGVDEFFEAALVYPARVIASLSAVFDRVVVDGLVRGIAICALAAGESLRRLQTGRLQQYIYFTYAGALLLAVVILMRAS
jgi:NADH-quinone oxidoreductase subunit L